MKGNNIIAVFLALLLSCQIGHTLDCYTCEYGICLLPIKKTCGTFEVCVTETSKLGGVVNMKSKGCMNPFNCMTDSSVSIGGITMTTSPSCCFSSLCNAAVTPRVSIISAMAAILSLWICRMF
ncbi:lymphocyte antigen 6 complex locus protein G6d-like [Pelobates fuscus]|uniref:lymphocyte antigen 6 complex locus protein G6d-like n=1 Tax=Pelobates fuscus TaxID=191477 RepID=UPI002FE45599